MPKLLINLADITSIGEIPMIGSPINLFIDHEKDNVSTYIDSKAIDGSWLVLETNKERATEIMDGLQVIANRKIKRNIRYKIRTR